MKKQFFISVFFAVYLSSFSFWKMEGPYVIDLEPNENSINQSYSINKEYLNIKNSEYYNYPEKHDIPFLYDPHTSTVISFKGPNNESGPYHYNILKNNFTYDNQFWESTKKNNQDSKHGVYPMLIFFKYKLNTLNDGTFDQKEIQHFKESLLFHIDFSSQLGIIEQLWGKEERKKKESEASNKSKFNRNNISFFHLSKEQTIYKNYEKDPNSPMNIKIENRENGVNLIQNNKHVDLQEALKKYFASSGVTNFVSLLGGDNLPKVYEKVIDKNKKPLISATTVTEITKINHPELDQESVKLLHECKILTLWNSIPEEIDYINKNGVLEKKKVYFKLIGLAEDKDGHKFHWITYLNNEISVLMQYAK